MRSFGSRIGSKAFPLTGFASVMLASVALATGIITAPVNDPTCVGNPGHKVVGGNFITIVPSDLSACNPPCVGGIGGVRLWSRSKCLTGVTANDSMTFLVRQCNSTCSDRVYVGGGYFPQGFSGLGSKEELRGPVDATIGTAWGGPHGLSTSFLPDSLSASVGLYSAGGLPDLTGTSNPNITSTFVTRDNVNNKVTLEIANGGLQTCALTGSQQSYAELRFIVYPDTIAANNDRSSEGAGAIYYGKIVLSGPAGQLYTEQGMSASEWTLTQSGGKWQAVPKPGLSKVISVPNATEAVVRVVGDARSAQSGPGQSPLILVLMTIALLGSGVWVIRSRRMPAAV
jgi:hypothetical protein